MQVHATDVPAEARTIENLAYDLYAYEDREELFNPDSLG